MQWRRTNFLINRRFQLRFSFFVCSWILGLSLVYPMIIYNLFDALVQYAAVDPTGPALDTLKMNRQQMIWLLVWLEVIFLLITFLISIFVSHRIAGPLYKLRKAFKEAAAGKMDQQITFRKDDHFKEIATDYNALIASIRSRMGRQTSAIHHIEKALQEASGAARAELEQALADLRGGTEKTT